MTLRPLVVVGDALLDRDLDGRAERLAPDAPVPVVDAIDERPRPGGAGLAAALAAAAGHPVTLVTALGVDAAGRRLRGLLEDAGVTVCDLGLRGETPEKIRVRAAGRALVRLDRGGEGASCGPLTAEAGEALAAAGVVLVSDYGRGIAAHPEIRAALEALPSEVPVVWDPHPKGPDPVRGVLLATPNAGEAIRLAGGAAAAGGDVAAAEGAGLEGGAAAGGDVAAVEAAGLEGGAAAGGDLAAVEAAGRALARRWRAVNVCVTLGARGALLLAGDGTPLAIPAATVASGDPCGAGDCFAAAAAARLAAGALPSEAVAAAVAQATAFVAAGGASGAAARGFAPTAPAPAASAAELAHRVRAAGGTVVATGGCFDLLYAGHVRALSAARALGDCLIVCLNSDASVRRLKGPERPLVGEADRAAVPSRLTSTTRSQASASTSPMAPHASVPAAVTTASMPPYSSATACTAASASRGRARSTSR